MTSSEQKQALINLRAQLVGAMHVQPFTIYQDTTIEALLAAKPKTLGELSKVKGFPAKGKRVQGFGEAVIAIFNERASSVTTKIDFTNGKPKVEFAMQEMSIF